jgi:hypothetical protein
MAGHNNDNSRYRTLKPTVVPSHRFAVGGMVAFRASAAGALEQFRVTRLLPDGGQGLQYRIHSERDGHERVVLEAALLRS